MDQIKREVVYLGRDNTVDLQLLANDVPIDLDAVTKYELRDCLCNWTIDSTVSPTAFDASNGNGELNLNLGDEEIPAGDQSAWLILYDPAHADGIVWGKVFFSVINICASP
jgi:hypothetical protein